MHCSGQLRGHLLTSKEHLSRSSGADIAAEREKSIRIEDREQREGGFWRFCVYFTFNTISGQELGTAGNDKECISH